MLNKQSILIFFASAVVALSLCAQNGTSGVDSFFSTRVRVNEVTDTDWEISISPSVPEILKESMIEFMKAVGDKDEAAMRRFMQSNHPNVVSLALGNEYTIKKGTNSVAVTPLQFAAVSGNVKGAKLLLDFAAVHPEYADRFLGPMKDGRSCLYIALYERDFDMVKMLHQFASKHHFATPLIRTIPKVSPVLLLAASRDDLDTIKALLALAQDTRVHRNAILATDRNGYNAFHIAVYAGHIEAVRLLLESPFRIWFLHNLELVNFDDLEGQALREMWKLILVYAPHLAQLHEDNLELMEFLQLEVAIATGNMTKVAMLQGNDVDQQFLNKMVANMGEEGQKNYLKYMWETDPVFYAIAATGIRMCEWADAGYKYLRKKQ
jgi:ankyrin repeat protein